MCSPLFLWFIQFFLIAKFLHHAIIPESFQKEKRNLAPDSPPLSNCIIHAVFHCHNFFQWNTLELTIQFFFICITFKKCSNSQIFIFPFLCVKRTFAIRFRYLLMNAVALRPVSGILLYLSHGFSLPDLPESYQVLFDVLQCSFPIFLHPYPFYLSVTFDFSKT